ncbi:hypothetical protein ASPACDRAFT_1877523 [Aspergillus aculeatus ATCC 16872]|uniref:Type 1 phosphatases regulator n=1 Tax=Aspergillus aculeatus (strain ATCC 16872 / CBS 172.66 / WB 5094) TaxID=690307 RepID=A0A1L9WEL4_ASPA1|nr:uncharacterized protein ASPACDRAFT_1877523 [Aspergillus aculeatus ATCC 16872]OJJ94620.1 hypothetical protein ASPACDRAFT_1877523 [Aspergillus aculeatus ATCC 16872]
MSQVHQTAPTSASGSRTESLAESNEGPSTTRISATLRLRAESAEDRSISNEHAEIQNPARHIQWRDDVIDNEGMGKKSSKVCCIYHKARPVGESSSESESSDSSESDSDSDYGDDGQTHRNGGRRSRHHMSCDHNSPGHTSSERPSDTGKTRRRKPSPNAYEKMPKTTRGR